MHAFIHSFIDYFLRTIAASKMFYTKQSQRLLFPALK